MQSNHVPNKGSIRLNMMRDMMQERMKDVKLPHTGLFLEVQEDIDNQLEELHLERVKHCPEYQNSHSPVCECHWCCHSEEFDEDTDECPKCQELIQVLIAKASWSEATLIERDPDYLCQTLNMEVVSNMSAYGGGEITISFEKMTHRQWWHIELTENEFAGFD